MEDEIIKGFEAIAETVARRVSEELRSAEPEDMATAKRAAQQECLAGEGIFSNAAMPPRLIRRDCRVAAESEQLLERAMVRLGLSARAHARIPRVRRTIADLEGSREIRAPHIAEAVGYRSLDRTSWT